MLLQRTAPAVAVRVARLRCPSGRPLHLSTQAAPGGRRATPLLARHVAHAGAPARLSAPRSAPGQRLGRRGGAASAAPVAAGSIAVSLPLWALGGAGALAACLGLLFAAVLVSLLPTLHAIRQACRDVSVACTEVTKCAGAVVVCTDAVIAACDDVELLANDIRDDWRATRAGVNAVTLPLERTLDRMKQATEPGAAAERVSRLQTGLVASLVSLAAALAALVAL